jgi:1,4-alpha-glucan branching enzyme
MMMQAILDEVAAGLHGDPHRVLGRHHDNGAIVFRTFRPDVDEATIHWRGERHPMVLSHPGGIYEARVDGAELPPPGDYTIAVKGPAGETTSGDPYAFSPTLGEVDLHLVGEGTHYRLYDHLGAHHRIHQGVAGTAFAVWAPEAARVAVVGDFNGWDGLLHAMRRLDGGVWELFVPEVAPGALYKFEVLTKTGERLVKADPFGRQMELRPSTASRVTVSDYRWGDEAWIKARGEHDPFTRPMTIYEVHLGSWRQHGGPRRHHDRPNWLSYRELADELVDYVVELGFTHVELLPVAEHPFDGSWGYQVGGYFAPTSRHGTPDDFRYFVDRCHQRGIGVLLDWVAAHFPKDAFGLGRFDGTALYEHLDVRQGEHKQWGTYVFNYDRPQVKNFLVANALYWLDEFHIDGLRADAVASMLYLDYAADNEGDWVPNEFGGRENLGAIEMLRTLNDTVKERHPGCVIIAEESTSWPGVTHPTRAGGLGFDCKWNMGWMHDTLAYFEKDPIHRAFHHGLVTFGLMYAFSERFVLPLSHDEVVHMKGALLDKMYGDRWRKLANLRALYAHMWAHPGKKLLFMGGEIGQWREWHEERALDWELLADPDHEGIQRLLTDLNRFYRDHPAMWQADGHSAGFRWIDANDSAQSVASYLRLVMPERGAREDDFDRDHVLCVGNFTPLPRHRYRVGVPRRGIYREALNTDATIYGGSGLGNLGAVEAKAEPCHGFDNSLELTLPPLSVVYFEPPNR